MTTSTIGLLSPGEMGHAVGSVLREHGLTVRTSLDGRSARSRTLAAKADIADAAERGVDPGCQGGDRSQWNHLAQSHPDRMRPKGIVTVEPVRIVMPVGTQPLDRIVPPVVDVPAQGHNIVGGKLGKQHGGVGLLSNI